MGSILAARRAGSAAAADTAIPVTNAAATSESGSKVVTP
jgi:hypothetical protein